MHQHLVCSKLLQIFFDPFLHPDDCFFKQDKCIIGIVSLVTFVPADSPRLALKGSQIDAVSCVKDLSLPGNPKAPEFCRYPRLRSQGFYWQARDTRRLDSSRHAGVFTTNRATNTFYNTQYTLCFFPSFIPSFFL